jgi:hypothetical protein
VLFVGIALGEPVEAVVETDRAIKLDGPMATALMTPG